MAQQDEGIMALSGAGAGAMAQEPQLDMREFRKQAFPVAKEAVRETSPEAYNDMQSTLSEAADEFSEMSLQELEAMLDVLDDINERPEEYPQIRKSLIEQGIIGADDLPEEMDVELFASMEAVLQEAVMKKRGEAAQMVQGPAGMMPPQGFAKGGIAEAARLVASKGRMGDTMLAHITPSEARLLKARGGAGSINPVTGLPEFFLKKVWKKVKEVGKKVLASPVGRIVATVALSMFIPAPLASALVTKLSGGSWKDTFKAAALTYLSGPTGPIGSYVSKALPMAGLNASLATGLRGALVGTGANLLMGGNLKDSVRAGITQGVIQGLNAQVKAMRAPTDAPSTAPSTPQSTTPTSYDAMGNPVDASGNPLVTPENTFELASMETQQAAQGPVPQNAANPNPFANPGDVTAPVPQSTFMTQADGTVVRDGFGNPIETSATPSNAPPGFAPQPAPPAAPASVTTPNYQSATTIDPNSGQIVSTGRVVDITAPPGATGAGPAAPVTQPSWWEQTKEFMYPSEPTSAEIAARADQMVAESGGRLPYAAAYDKATDALTPGPIAQYGPAVGAGLGVAALTGAFDPKPEEPPPNADEIGAPIEVPESLQKPMQNLPGVVYDSSGNIVGSRAWDPSSGQGGTGQNLPTETTTPGIMSLQSPYAIAPRPTSSQEPVTAPTAGIAALPAAPAPVFQQRAVSSLYPQLSNTLFDPRAYQSGQFQQRRPNIWPGDRDVR